MYLETATKMTEVQPGKNYLLKLLNGGKTGSGKSTLGMSVPGRKLILDYDGRKESLAGFPDVEVISFPEPNRKDPAAWDKATGLRQELWAVARKSKENFPYSLIMEDGLGSMLRFCMNWCLTLNPKRGFGGAPVEGHYGALATNAMGHIIGMKALPCHYILNCHLAPMTDATDGSIVYFPQSPIGGKMVPNSLPAEFNEIWRMAKVIDDRSKKYIYHLFTGGGGESRYDFFKSALNHLGRYWTDPVTVEVPEDLNGKEAWGIQALINKRFSNDEKRR